MFPKYRHLYEQSMLGRSWDTIYGLVIIITLLQG
jgi:hypothetical protein